MCAGLLLQDLNKKCQGGFCLEGNLFLKKGISTYLVGKSGIGKTTLFSILAGWIPLRVGEGCLFLDQTEITHLSPQKRNMTLCTQENTLFPSLCVWENAAFSLLIKGVFRKKAFLKVQPWLQEVGLERKAQEGISGLSGGEIQRLSFVRALVAQPKVLLLDEPFQALDLKWKTHLSKLLNIEIQKHQIAMLWITHERAFHKTVCGKTYQIQKHSSNLRVLKEV